MKKVNENRNSMMKKKSIDTAKDPYLNKNEPADGSHCRKCGAVFQDKRWTLSDEARSKATPSGGAVLCPACQKIREGYAEGYVTLSGDFLADHKEEIINLVRNKEERAMYVNPLSRIIDIRESDGNIEIRTTTAKLAQRIGQILEKAYKGTVDYKWSDDVKIARVAWSR